MDSERPDITGRCPSGFKICGSTKLSSPSQLTCVPKSGEIVITSDADIEKQK